MLGEGATYDAHTDTAWWFDILRRRLFQARVASGEVTIHELPVMASALAAIDDERQLVSAEDGLYLRTRSDASMRLMHPIRSGRIRTRSNDARVHPSGTFWFSGSAPLCDPAQQIEQTQPTDFSILATGREHPRSARVSGTMGRPGGTPRTLEIQVRSPEDGAPHLSPGLSSPFQHEE
jgi:sugar lactone lactonase YvrE